jgi:hypothetical protein
MLLLMLLLMLMLRKKKNPPALRLGGLGGSGTAGLRPPPAALFQTLRSS